MDKFSSSRTKITNKETIKRYLPASQPAVFIYRKPDKSLSSFRGILYHRDENLFFEYDNEVNDIKIGAGDEIFVRVFSPGAQFNEFRIVITQEEEQTKKMLCSLPPLITRVQRRKSYRVILSLDVVIMKGVLTENAAQGGHIWLNNPLEFDYQDNMLLETRMLDLSIGGMLVLSYKPYEINNNITVFFPVIDKDGDLIYLEIGARCCRNREITTKNDELIYHSGFEFININNKINQVISRYVTRLQIKSRRDNEDDKK